MIDNLKQNKPSLVLNDLYGNHPIISQKNRVYGILLDRGIFKWLSVRRRLIRLKNEWKAEITETLDEMQMLKDLAAGIRKNKFVKQKDYCQFKQLNQKHRAELRGYLKALNKCRQEVRELCHSPRMQCPNNDSRAREWFREVRRNGK